MSLAWMDAVVLRREPWSAVFFRALRRAILPGVGLWLSGVPGTSWSGSISPLWLRIVVFAIAVATLLLFVLAFANVAVNKRVLLVCRPTGAIERPRSIQERWLKIPGEYVTGRTISVVTEMPLFGRADPRVTLHGGPAETVKRVPLYGTPVDAFVAESNKLLAGRGVSLVLAEPPVADDGKE